MTLSIDSIAVPDDELHRYSLRWYLDGTLCIAVLYRDGKRITKGWTLTGEIKAGEDLHGGNANTN